MAKLTTPKCKVVLLESMVNIAKPSGCGQNKYYFVNLTTKEYNWFWFQIITKVFINRLINYNKAY